MTSKTLHGIVTVTVGDNTYTLTPTLAAVRKIEAELGALTTAMQRVNGYSVDACAAVIAASANVDDTATQALPEQVFQSGVRDVATALMPYLLALLNPRGAEQEQDAKGNAKPAKATEKVQ